jgi:hypothetical protein
MTLPYERTNAVLRTKNFLLNLCNPKATPRVPKTVRDQARCLLRHYPTNFDMETVSENDGKVFGKWDQFERNDNET